ncbi:MAG: hypothetical protein J7L15_03150 [Clostridiales bacterium]|nr:hypothetical protein [Clostridiales bacterium]
MTPTKAKKITLPFYAIYKDEVVVIHDIDELAYDRVAFTINKQKCIVYVSEIEQITKEEYPEYWL